MKKLYSLVAVFGAVLYLTGCMSNPTRGRIPAPQPFHGIWDGQARIIVCPCDQETLHVNLRVLPSGYVMGRVGEAALRRAYIAQNEGWQGRFFSRDANYLLKGRLVGRLADGMELEEGTIVMPLYLDDDVIHGEVHAREGNGDEISESFLFSATDMNLRKVADH